MLFVSLTARPGLRIIYRLAEDDVSAHPTGSRGPTGRLR